MLVLAAGAGAARAAECGDNSNQRELDACAGRSFQKADAELNADCKRVVERLKDDADTAKLLVQAQKSWLAFRDAECEFSTALTRGGTIRSMLVTMCREKLTRKRIGDLKAYLHCEEGALDCPVPAQ
jgi:uncharacterized protein YecT (DUF1311 family)